MNFCPSTIDELQGALAQASADRRRMPPADLTRLNRVLEHKPEDLTCTVECGLTLAQLQGALAGQGQWLPVDPPHADRLSLRDVIDGNRSGPRGRPNNKGFRGNKGPQQQRQRPRDVDGNVAPREEASPPPVSYDDE